MLIDPKMYQIVEEALMKNGSIARFEREQGEIKGHMMVTLCNVPDEYLTTRLDDEQVYGFEASFDFYDSTAAFAFYPKSKIAGSGIWVTPQIEGAEPPSREWIEFFVHTVLDNIQEDGSFGIPMYSFVADVGDMTVVPTAPDRKDEDIV